MGMFSYICKGCGQEIITGELCRFNGGDGRKLNVGEYDGYGRCGRYDAGEDHENPVAWHEYCYQKSPNKGDKLPSQSAPNQGFGPNHLQYMEDYEPESKTTYSIGVETWVRDSDPFEDYLYFFTGDKWEDQEKWNKDRRQAEDKFDVPYDDKDYKSLVKEFDAKWGYSKAPEHRTFEFDSLEEAKAKAFEFARQYEIYVITIYGTQPKASGMVYKYSRIDDVEWKDCKYTYLGTYTEKVDYDIDVATQFKPNKKQLMKEVLEIRSKLFDIANAFSGEETGNVAVAIHQACNQISMAFKFFDIEAYRKARNGEPNEYTENE